MSDRYHRDASDRGKDSWRLVALQFKGTGQSPPEGRDRESAAWTATDAWNDMAHAQLNGHWCARGTIIPKSHRERTS